MSFRNFIQRTQLLLDQALYESRRALEPVNTTQAVEVTPLEERLLMSASPVAVAADVAPEAVEPPEPVRVSTTQDQQTLDVLADAALPPAASVTPTGERLGENTFDAADASNANLNQAQTLELVIIDSSVSQLEQMVADLRQEDALDDHRSLEIVVLDAERDGVAQITAALLQYDGIDGVHIVSHGSAGQVRLGSTVLSLDTLDTYRSAINAWQHSLTPEADLLFYGCDLAATDEGRELMRQISAVCDCDVSASEDLTGQADLGGDWELEYTVGQVETDVVFSDSWQTSWRGVLAGITVTTTSDTVDGDADVSSVAALLLTPGSDGEVSLREAILATNNTAGTDTISFNISDPLVDGAHTIALASALPEITDTLIIDGSSEPDVAGNGNRPVVVLDGGGSVLDGLVLTATADNSEIRGLSLRSLQNAAIVINSGADSVTIAGNFIGRLAPDGSDSGGGDIAGVAVSVNGSNAIIGGTTAADRNVIAGATQAIVLDGVSGAVVSGNFLGTTADGSTVIGIAGDGILLQNGASFNTIGGASAAAANVIAGTAADAIRVTGTASDDNTIRLNQIGVSADGNTRLGLTGNGVFVTGGADRTVIEDNLIAGAGSTGITIDGTSISTRIEGNVIGTDATGTFNWGVGGDGILITGGATDTQIGDITDGDGNTIVYSGQTTSTGAGVAVQDGSTGISIRGNSVHSNRGVGIDLNETLNDGADVNDATDSDTGGNNRLNTPVLASASVDDADTLSVALDLTPLPAGTYTVDFYASSTAATGAGERYLYSVTGLASGYTGTLTQTITGLTPGDALTAVAVDEATADTSEFSRHAIIVDADAGGTAPSRLQVVSSTAGLALNTAGGNDRVVVVEDGNAVFDGLTALTWEVRFSSTALSAGTTLASYTTAGGDDLFRLRIADDGTGLNFAISGSANSVDAGGYDFSTLSDGEEHTLTLTWDGGSGDWKVFVDGRFADSGSGAATGTIASTAASLVLGQEQDDFRRDFDPAQAFQGTLHNVRVFSAVRSASEIAADYRSDLPFDTTALLADWRFQSLTADGQINDAVAGNNASIETVAASGFTAGTAELRLEVLENPENGTVVGTVAGIDAEREALIASLLAADPYLFYSSATQKFYQLTDLQTNWSTASTNALATNLNGVAGQLVTIRSAWENEYVRELAEMENLSVFIGGTDSTVDGEWRWQSAGADADAFWSGGSGGTSQNGAWHNWAPGQPGNAIGANGIRLEESTGFWHEVPVGSVSRRSVIEWDAATVLAHGGVGSTGAEPLSYEIVSQTQTGAFTVDAATGEIRVADASQLDYENPPTTHSVVIRVSDAETPARTYEQTFEIHLTDVVDTDTVPTALHTGLTLNTDGGTDAFLAADDAGSLLGGRDAVSVELTVSLSNAVDQQVLLSYATSNSTDDLLLVVSDDGSLQLTVAGSQATASGIDYFALLTDGRPHTVAVTWDNTHGDWTIHVDGAALASGSGLSAGSVLGGQTGDSGLIFGHRQASIGGSFAAAESFSGTLYDIRLWNVVRTDAELRFSHGRQFDPADSAPGLIANWQMTDLDASRRVLDEVSGHVLRVGHANEAEFRPGTPAVGLQISENAADGTALGRIVPRDPGVPVDLVADGRFLAAPTPASIDDYLSGQSLGDWDVTAGSVSLHGPLGARSPQGGLSVDLNGSAAGTIQQDLTTTAGVEYQVVFAVSGRWDGGEAVKDLRVSAGSTTADFALTEPPGWSSSNKLWAPRSFTFTASGPSTTLQFSSLDVTGGMYGPMIADVQVYAVPAAVSTLLNSDPSLSYDAGTGKFYRLESGLVSFSDARTAAANAQINGVAGRLVTIESAWENDLVTQLAQAQGGSLWIGGSDADSEGNWSWLDTTTAATFWTGGLGGSAVNGHYQNWGSGEPDNSTGLLPQGEDAAAIAPAGTWYDWEDDASNQLGYVVEWDASELLNRYTYSLNDPSGQFELTSDGLLQVRSGHTLDHDVSPEHDVDVTVTDAAGHSFTQTLTIAVQEAGGVADQYLVREDSVLSVAASGVLSNDTAVSLPDPAGNVVLSFDARTDTDGNATWDGTDSSQLSLTGVSHTASPTTPPAGITAAFDFDGSGGAISAALDSLPSVDSTQSGSVELWVRLDSTVASQTLLDLGSDTDGLSLSVSAGQLILTHEQGAGSDTASVSGVSAGTWHHVALTVDIISGTSQQAVVWLDGTAVISRTYTSLTNWAGGDFGLGTVNGTAAGSSNGNMVGEVASFRVHDRVLSADQIATLVAHPDALAAGHARVSSVDDTSTLGQVSVNADGSFTYDPNGQFAALQGGQTGTDTFRYTVDDGTGATETVTVTLTILGSGEPAITQPATVTLNEDSPYTLTAGDLVQIDDGISADTRLQVTISVDSGTLALSENSAVTRIEGDDSSGRLVIEGLQSDLNTALADLIYTPFADTTGTDTLTVTLAQAADLQAHYTFDDATASDSSPGIAHHGRLEGTASITTSSRGPVLNLDAAGEQLVVDSVFDQPASVTVAGWVNLSTAGTQAAEFVSISDDLILRLDHTVYGTSLWARTASGWNVVSTGESLRGTGWRHVAATFDDTADQQVVYLDGRAVATQAYADSITWTGGTSTIWGAHAGGGSDYDLGGQIDDARVYTRALSAAEIAALAAEQTSLTDTTAITVTAVNDSPSFHTGDGLVVTDFGNGDDRATAVAVMPDGRVVVAGYASNGSDDDFAVARYLPDGSPDTTLGGTGRVTLPIGGADDQAWAVAVQDDGRILLAGESANGAQEVAIVRLQSDGTLDNSWGGDGIVTSDFGSGSDFGYDLTVQPDGRVLVSGRTWNGSGYDILLARYTTSGTLDTFGTGGFVTTSVGTADATGNAVDVRADGRIVVGGQAVIGGHEDLAVVRYLSDGTLDTTFGGDGIVTTPVTAQADGINDIVSLDDGRLLVGGVLNDGSETNYVLVRYLNDGSLDTSFGASGLVVSALAGDDTATSLAVTPDGQILLAATAGSSPTTITIARYDAAGALDTSFGSSGLVVENLSSSGDVSAAIAVRPDGGFVVTGTTQAADTDFVLLSLNADGTRDTSFDVQDTLSHAPTWLEGGDAVILEPNVTLIDPELTVAGFDGSHLILQRTGGADSQDQFSATGTLGPLTPAGPLTVGGVTVGTVASNSGGTLRLNFSGGDATASRINAVLRQIAYSNAADTPPTSVSLTWTFNDGNDGVAQGSGAALQATGTTTVTIQPTPDPAVTAPVTVTLDEDTSTPFDGSNTLSVNSGLTTDTRVQVRLTAGSGSLTVTPAGSVTIADGSNGSGNLLLAGLESDINTTLASLVYDPAAESSGTTTLNAELSLSADLEAEYHLAGDATDSSVGVAQDGTTVGTAAFTNDATRGQVLLLDGGGHVAISTDFGQPATATVSGWVQLDAAAGNAVLWDVGGDLELRIDTTGGVTGRFHDGSQWQQTVSGIDIRGAGWQHLAYTVDADNNTQVLYLNGLEVARTHVSGGVADVASFVGALIGTDGSGNSLVGRINDARLHTRALSAEEIGGLAIESLSATASVSVTVNAVNDAPEIASLHGDVLGYTEGDGAQLIDQNADAAITDVDSPDFNGGTLVVSFTGGSDASQDVLSVRDQGPGSGNVTLSGTTILYSGVSVATMNGGSSGTPLTITFNAASSPLAATQVLRNITFENTNTAAATAGVRTISFVMSDGDGATGVSLTQTASVNVGSPNDAPIITSATGGGTYYEGATGTYFNNGLTVTDADSPDFDGGRLTVTVAANGETEDRLFVREGGGVTLSGSTVLFDPGAGSVAVATFTGGDGSSALEITFQSAASGTAVQSVARQVAFASVSDTPSTAQRTLQMQLTDGDGGTSTTVSRTMNVVPVNDAPQLDLDANDDSGSLVNDYQTSFTEGGGAVLVADTDATLSDADHVNLASLTVVLTNPQEAGSAEQLSADTTGTALVAGWTQATHTLTISGVGTVEHFETVLRTIRYNNTSTNPQTATDRILTFVADDGSDESLIARTTVEISSVDNLPTISAISSQTINEDTATGALAFVVGDAETAVGSLVVTATSDNQTIIPDSNITLAGSGANRTVDVLPAAHQNGGPVTITLSVFDGANTVQTSFTVSVTPRNDTPTGLPVVTGTPAEDQTLSADVSGIGDDDGLGTFNYQWLRNGGVISGASSATFDLSDADVGTQISVSVAWVDGQGNAESLTSLPTSAVANINDAPTTSHSVPLDLVTDEENPTSAVTVSALLTHAGWSDADAAPQSGVAVIATSDQGGQWQYSTDGSNWVAITGTSDSSSLLLSDTAQLRFLPGSDDAVTATLTWRAWDQTAGTASTQATPQYASTLTTGGTSAFDDESRQIRAIVSAVADEPVISHLAGDALLYAEADAASPLDQLTAATVTDVDSDDFNGGSLTVAFDSGSTPGEDVLQIRNQGTATGQIGVSGFNVTYGGTLIGTLSGGASGTPLQIDFNASASTQAAEALIRSVTYLNTNTTNPTVGVRAVRFTLNDGDGGVSSATTAVSVSRVNDEPVLTAPTSATVFEETQTTISGISVADVDAGTSEITLRAQATQGTLNVTLAGAATISSGSNASGDLTIRGTLSEVNATLASLDYTGHPDITGTAADILTLTVSDLGNTGSGGVLTDTAAITIDITPVNDPPVLVNNGFSILEGGTVTLSSLLLQATDVDSVQDDLTFTVTNVTGGQFELVSAPQIAVSSFQQSQVSAGSVRFVHDGGESAPAYDVTVSDGSQSVGPQSGTVIFTNVNDAPVISGLGGDAGSAVNDGVAVRIDTGVAASIEDPESPASYDGALLQVAQTAAETGDLISLDTTGNVQLSAGMSNGSQVRVSGIIVGTLSNVTAATLDLTFHASADVTDVNTILNALQFSTTSSVLGARSIDVTFNDGGGTLSGGSEVSSVATAFLSVAGAGDGNVSTNEDTTYTFVPTDFDFTGVTGSGLQEIELLTLPASGTLRYNGAAATVGQIVSQADIQNGLFTFVPAADENGFNYGTFDFQVNNGKANVTILAGEASFYTLTGGALFHTEDILTDPDNFGPGGIYASSFSMIGQTSTIGPAYLNQGSILFNGYVPDGSWTPQELSDLGDWVHSGGVLISNSDSSGYDDVSAHFGLTIGGTGTTNWLVDDVSSPLINGPFGSVGPVGTTIRATGAISYFDSSSLAAGDLVIAIDSGSLEPTIVLRQHGSGWILFTSDEGIFRVNMSGGGNVATSNDTLAANIFAWAADQVPATSSHTMNVSVLARNDDPVNNGTLPSTFVVNEDQQTAVDFSSLDLSDRDAAANSLTVTLTTQNGGQLSAIASGGVSVNGSGSATLELTGSQSDLNAFFDNALNVSFTSAADQNGLAADRITVQVTDNGNLGDGGGGQIALGGVDVDVVAVNDAPVTTAPAVVTIVEETPTLLTGFTVADVDAGSDPVSVRLQAADGTLSLTLSGAVVSAGSNASADLTISGTLPQLNNALATLLYVPNPDVVGTAADQIVMTVNDGGNNGSGGSLQVVRTVQVDVVNVNDEQLLATNAGLLLDEGDLAITIGQADLEVSDVDNLPVEIVYVLDTAPTSGTLRLSGVALTASDTFTQDDINAGRFTYDHNDAEVFLDQFTFTADDGSGLTTTGDFDIVINPVNDNNPVLTSNGGLASIAVDVAENTLAVVDVDASDIDLPTQSLTYAIGGGADAALFTVNPGSGQLSFAASPDYESVIDADGNNVYEVVVEVRDGLGRSTVQNIAVTVTNVDEFGVGLPFDADTAAREVAENSPAGTSVGLTVAAIDGDRSDLVTYTLDDDAGGRFAIDSVSGVVTLAADVDRETDASFTITARGSSSDGTSATQDFVITINDVDEFDVTAITDLASADERIAENVAVGTSVGVVASASDADATNNLITWSLDDNAGGLLTINPTSGQVTTAAPIDFETVGSSLTFTARATSQDGSFRTRTWNVTVQDLDEFDVVPIIDTDTTANSVSENLATGSAVGVTAFSQDADATDSNVFYSLDDTAGGRFTIDPISGLITTARVLDFESGGASHDVIVRARSEDDSTITTIITIAISDQDEFDATAIVDTDTAAERIAENVAVGTATGFSAFSEDADGSLNAITYTLDDDAGGLFRVDAVSGQILTNAAIDYETTGSLATVVVRATSADGSSATQLVAVTIEDVNEFPAAAIIDTHAAPERVTENAPIGTRVGLTAFSEDRDATTNSIVYSLDDTAGGLFTIDPLTGEVTTAALPDFETLGGPQDVIVRATSADGSFAVRSFSVDVLDTNDTAPVIAAGQQFVVSEFAVGGTSLGAVTAADADTVGSLSGWSITAGNTDGVLGIHSSTGELFVADPTLLNHEQQAAYTLTVRVTDGLQTAAAQTVVVNVTDENDAPVLTASAFDIDEHTSVGTVVDTAVTFDEDIGETLTYSLQGPPAQAFAIDPVTGVITVADPTRLDFEIRTSLTMTVQVEDGGGLTDVRVLTIHINDVNEQPQNITFAGGSVNENAAAGTFVVQAIATDIDAGDLISWSLVDTAGGRFQIDAGTGEVQVADGDLLNFEDQAFHDIIVRATDLGGLFLDETLTVTINDVNEAPVAGDDFFEAKQLEDLIVDIAGGVTANDSDVDGDIIRVIIVTPPENGSLSLEADGSFTYTPTGVYSGPDSFAYLLTDGQLYSDVATVEIDVLTTVTGDSGDKAVVIEPTTSTDTTEPDLEVEEDVSETEETDSAESEQPLVAASSASASAGEGSGEEAAGVASSSSREILQRTSSSLFVAVFLDDVPVVDGLDENGRGGRRDRSDGGERLGRALPRFLFEQVSTDAPFLRTTTFDITQADFPVPRKNDSFLNVVMESVVVGSSAAVTTSVSVGYVVWLVRGGSLVTSVLSSIPVWQGFDPLPVLENFEEESGEDAESLASMVS